jgi:hypothetical protein
MLRKVLACTWMGLLLASAPSARAGDSVASVAPRTHHDELDPITIVGYLNKTQQVIAQRVAEASRMLIDVPLHYTFLKRLTRESLRGRPVIFAAWSERSAKWHTVEIEMPFPVPRLKPGKAPSFRVLTPGYEAVHVRGTGAERLMFDIFHNGEKLSVYGRKYPMIDAAVAKKEGIRAAVSNAETITYLPMTDDSTPLFAAQGQQLLRSTAEAALGELRASKVKSFAYPGKLLGDTVLPETLISLAVIEQTDDAEFKSAPAQALNKTLGHYGLMRSQAFTYSVSIANAAGPMQFTDKRGNGTYSMVVRRCTGANLSRDFDAGARDLLNAMKAAACLLDMDISNMPDDVQDEYSQSPAPVSIFGVAAYNGGGGNAAKLLKAVRLLKTDLADLRIPELAAFDKLQSRCPCLWADRNGQTTSISLPAYNRENVGYVDKYLRLMSMLLKTAEPTP